MPKIQFSDLPRGVWNHLLQWVDERGISLSDLLTLQAWVRTNPSAPEGDWYKDFGSWFPKTVLENEAVRRADRIVRSWRLDMARSRSATDALETLHRRFYAGRPRRLKKLEELRGNEEIAGKIHELRVAAGLTQAQLAKVIGTTASVICRLEDAEYEGHSLAMLRRIGGALHQRVEIRFVPLRRSA